MGVPGRRSRGNRHRSRSEAHGCRRRAGSRAGRAPADLVDAHTPNSCRRGDPGVTLADWLDPLWEAAEMRAADKHAIEEAEVPSLDLMERAGAGLARVVAEAAGEGPIRVVIGKGNNGGRGREAARPLPGGGPRAARPRVART